MNPEEWNPKWNYTTGIRYITDSLVDILKERDTLTSEELSWFHGSLEQWLINHEVPPGEEPPVDKAQNYKPHWWQR